MQLLETVIKNTLQKKVRRINEKMQCVLRQEKVLKNLLSKAQKTSFGRNYGFAEILESEDFIDQFQQKVPIFDYEKMYKEWWNRLLKGEENISWPGKVSFFGLTSGTSNDSSKRVPVTIDMIKAIQKTSTHQLFALSGLDLPPKFLYKKFLMLGGCTDLIKVGNYFEGDLSGILTGNLPFWFTNKYKPGKQISKVRDWNIKLDEIVKKAPQWDIGGIAGVPAWVQMLLEKIIDHYGLKSIHDIWPDFCVYLHGGVSFDPYKNSFNKLLSKKVHYLETYLASEGFLAYQLNEKRNMQLVVDNGIFFEFIPFTNENFRHDGSLISKEKPLTLNQVQENTDYAILISTVSGAWRYLIGDTIRFTSVVNNEIVITGRTKHFLSLCGEHLSVDNMNKAVEIVSNKLNIDIKEFTVAGIPYGNFFAHKWYLGLSTIHAIDEDLIKRTLDDALKLLNDDYAVERSAALKEIFVEIIDENAFYQWMKIKGKIGGQHKFPRVINGKYEEWENYLANGQSFTVKYNSSELC